MHLFVDKFSIVPSHTLFAALDLVTLKSHVTFEVKPAF